MTDEHIAYNALASCLRGNYRELARLKEQFGSWRTAFAEPLLSKRGVNPEALAAGLRKNDIRLILESEPDFPPLLREIPWRPFGIYVRGALPPPSEVTVAIVGTRKATEEGKDLAHQFAKELARTHITIVSGLAFGIDAAAHLGTLAGKGRTLIVLAGGVDHFSPRMNERIAQRVLDEGGAVISEYPPGVAPLPQRFIERNRIVSGLSRGILLIEAPERSGSLTTARFALDQNRDVFVVPGPANHPNYRGSHALIRAGAELVTEPAHILAALGLAETPTPAAETLDEATITKLLKDTGHPLAVDKIIELTKLNAQTVS